VHSDRFLQAAGHSLSLRREKIAAVVISVTKRHTPESVVNARVWRRAYSDVDPLCQLRHPGLRQQGVEGHLPGCGGAREPNFPMISG
jgi:hypothetical protein